MHDVSPYRIVKIQTILFVFNEANSR